MVKGKQKESEKENQEVNESTDIQQEPEQEVKVVEKVVEVEKPIEVQDMSKPERQKLIKDIEKQDIEDHLAKEAKRIESTTCPKCDAPLKLKAEDYMQEGNIPKVIECAKCENLVRVFVNYKASPQISRADISTKSRGYAWATQRPGDWKDKHVKRFVEEEQERLENNISSLSEEGQKLFRIQLLILKKLKVIK